MSNLLTKSILAGVIIALATNTYLLIEHEVISALMFSIGILLIREFNLHLFTSEIKNFFQTSKKEQFLIMLLGNFIGSQVFVYFQEIDVLQQVIQLQKELPLLFIDSIFCGVLISLGTSTKNKFLTSLCIATFIINGFEHSIVNMCWLIGRFDIDTTIYLLVNILGNTIGAITTYQLIKKGE